MTSIVGVLETLDKNPSYSHARLCGYIPIVCPTLSPLQQFSQSSVTNIQSFCLYADTLAGYANWMPDCFSVCLLRTIDETLHGSQSLYAQSCINRTSIACGIAWWHRQLLKHIDAHTITRFGIGHLPMYLDTNNSPEPGLDYSAVGYFSFGAISPTH